MDITKNMFLTGYINGNMFSKLADHIIDFDHEKIDFNFKRDAIIFCKTDFLEELFEYIKDSDKNCLLISHMSDYPIDKERFESRPDCVKKWFAQNAVYNHPDLISIPIGLENHKGKSMGKFTDHKWFIQNAYELSANKKDLRLYCNWNNDTSMERKQIIERLKKSDIRICYEQNLSFKDYCYNMSHHQFVVAPPGNGIDTHRVWEALYLGCYPIVIKNRIYKDYDLPIMQVNNYSEVNYELLNKFLIKRYNDNMMYMKYWVKKIGYEWTKFW